MEQPTEMPAEVAADEKEAAAWKNNLNESERVVCRRLGYKPTEFVAQKQANEREALAR